MSGSTTVKAINVSMSANTEKFESGMKRSRGAMTEFERGAERMRGALGELAKNVPGMSTLMSVVGKFGGVSGPLGIAAAGIASITAAIGAGMYVFKGVAENMEAMSHAAKGIGIAPGQLSSLQYAFKIVAGMDAGSSQSALGRMTKFIGQASLGPGSQRDLMNALKLDPAKMSQMSGRDQFYAIGEAISRIGNRSQQAAVGLEILGRDARDLVGALSEGTSAFASAEKHFSTLGPSITDVDRAAMHLASVAMADLGVSWGKLQTMLSVEFAPIVTDAFRMMTAAVAGFGRTVKVVRDAYAEMNKYVQTAVLGHELKVPTVAEPKKLSEPAELDMEANKKWAAESKRILEQWEQYAHRIGGKLAALRASLTEDTPFRRLNAHIAEINKLFELGTIKVKERNQLMAAAYYKDIGKPMAEAAQERFKKTVHEAQAAFDKFLGNTKVTLPELKRLAKPSFESLLKPIQSTEPARISSFEAGSQGAQATVWEARRGNEQSRLLIDIQKKALQYIQDMAQQGITISLSPANL